MPTFDTDTAEGRRAHDEYLAEVRATFPKGESMTQADVDEARDPKLAEERLAAEAEERRAEMDERLGSTHDDRSAERAIRAENEKIGQTLRDEAARRQQEGLLVQAAEGIVDSWEELVEYNEEGDPQVTPELAQRMNALVQAGAPQELFEEIAEATGDEDVVWAVVGGIQNTAEQARLKEEAAEIYGPAVAGVSEFRRLAELNPGLDTQRAWTMFEHAPLGETEEEAKEMALSAFKMVAAEENQRERESMREQLHANLYADGDLDYYKNHYLPRLAHQAQTDPNAMIQLRELTKPETLDLDEQFPELRPRDPERAFDPGDFSTASRRAALGRRIAEGAKQKMIEESQKEPPHIQWARASEAAARENFMRDGTPPPGAHRAPAPRRAGGR